MKKIIGLAFLGLFVLTVSCEREDAHHKHEDINVIRNIKLSDLTALQGAFSQNSNAGYRSSNTTNYFDLIDENNITVITRSNGDKTYTFSLKIAEEDKLTNLVVRELGSEYEFDLVEYSSNDFELWKTDIKNNLRSSVEVIITVTPLSGGAICITDGYVCPSGLHTSGQELQCTYSFGEWSYFLMQAPCDLSSGGGSGGGNGGGNSNGNTPPVSEEPEPYTEPVFPELTSAIADFIASQSNWNNLAPQIKTKIVNYLLSNIRNNIINQQAQEFANWAIDFLINNPNTSFDDLLNNRTGFDVETGDFNNNSIGGYDNTTYEMVNPNNLQQDWPTIESVIPVAYFVGWDRNLPDWHCMDYAKAQIAKKGYTISNYDAPGQTFQIYTESNGVDVDALWEGVSYLKYALSNGIPVIVGIDNQTGSSNPYTDNTTDHFIVIVGTGVNFQGEIYFTFFDNATNIPSQGASPYNMLFLDNILNMLVGQTEAAWYRDNVAEYGYIVTQIRKSK